MSDFVPYADASATRYALPGAHSTTEGLASTLLMCSTAPLTL